MRSHISALFWNLPRTEARGLWQAPGQARVASFSLGLARSDVLRPELEPSRCGTKSPVQRPQREPASRRGSQQVDVDPADAHPSEPARLDEGQRLVVSYDRSGGQGRQQRKDLVSASKWATGQLSDHEGMRPDLATTQALGQRLVASSKMVDPDRRVDQHAGQRELGGRRRGTGLRRGSVPPRSASRPALACAMSAARPAWSTAVFCFRPVRRWARRSSPSSRLRVVRICISVLILCRRGKDGRPDCTGGRQVVGHKAFISMSPNAPRPTEEALPSQGRHREAIRLSLIGFRVRPMARWETAGTVRVAGREDRPEPPRIDPPPYRAGPQRPRVPVGSRRRTGGLRADRAALHP